MRYFGVIVCAGLVSCIGTSASDQDCAALGDKFVELYTASLSKDAKQLPPEVLDNAAATGREEIVAQCKAKSTPKATVQRCLAATSLDEFEGC